MKTCKICNGDLIPFISYNNQPKAAQYFPTEETKQYDLGITLEIYQCKSCSIIQIPEEPVEYYDHAIRSPLWDTDTFRIEQRNNLIKEFRLQGKKIKTIRKTPTPEKYDAFLMFNYLEHFPDPRKVLNQLYENLEDNGVGIVEVPNFDEIIRDKIFGEFIIDHLFYFTSHSLRLLCEMSGFDVIRIDEIWGGASLSITIKKRKLLNAAPFIENQNKLITDMDNFVLSCGKVTIWGAGHQILMMLTMMNSIDNIPYIIDSFKRKQNTFTPVTHKLVMSSEYLEKNPIDGIIINVGWQYKDVIKAIEKLNLNPNVKIAVIKKATLEIL